jgi:hypothetical protein
VVPVLDPADVPLATGVGELQDELAVVLVHAVHELAPERDPLVAIEHRVVREHAPADVDRDVRRDDRPDAARREALLEVDPGEGAAAVVVVDPPGHARAHDAVRDHQVPKAQRLEDHVGVGHAPSLDLPLRAHGAGR